MKRGRDVIEDLPVGQKRIKCTHPFTFTEVWDMDAVDRLIASPHTKSADVVHLRGVKDRMDAKGLMNVVYKPSPSVPDGRLFATSCGAQRIRSAIRNECCGQFYHDIDIVNAFPTLARHAAEECGESIPVLNDFVDNRTGIVADVANDTGATHKNVKQAFLIALHVGGDAAIKDALHYTEIPPAILRLRMGMKRLIPKLATMYPHLHEMATSKASLGKKKPESVFMSYVCQLYERVVIDALVAHFTSIHLRVGALMFDGLLVQRDASGVCPDLQAAADRVFALTGVKVCLSEKPMDYDAEVVDDTDPDDSDSSQSNTSEYTEERVRKIQFETGGYSVIALKSPCGTGKTHQAMAHIWRQVTRHGLDRTRVLWVCSRISQAMVAVHTLNRKKQDYSSGLGFVSYKSPRNGKHLNDENRLVIQYESLWRLTHNRKNFIHYDFVVVDEFRSMLTQMVSGVTNGARLMNNYRLLSNLITSHRCLLMDADMHCDPSARQFLDGIGAHVQYINNQATGPDRSYYVMSDEEWYGGLKADHAAGKKVMVCFRTKKMLRVVAERLGVDVNATVGVRCFSGDSTTFDMRFWRDADASAEHVDLLMFTSKITTGADFSKTTFDVVYLHCQGFGCNARDMRQMMMRARKVTDSKVRVLLDEPKRDAASGCTKEVADYIKSIDERGKSFKDFIQTVRASSEIDIEVTSSANPLPEWGTHRKTVIMTHIDDTLKLVFANVRYEQNRPFHAHFVEHAGYCDYPIEYSDGWSAAKVDIKGEMDDIKSRDEEAELLELMEYVKGVRLTGSMTDDVVWRDLRKRSRSGELMPIERVKYDIIRLFRFYNPACFGGDKTDDDIMAMLQWLKSDSNRDTLWRYHLLKDTVSEKQRVHVDLQSVMNSAVCEERVRHGQHCTRLHKLLTSIGLLPIGDDVDLHGLDAATQARAMSDCLWLLKSRRGRAPRKAAKDRSADVIRRLRSECRHAGYKLVCTQRTVVNYKRQCLFSLDVMDMVRQMDCDKIHPVYDESAAVDKLIETSNFNTK